MIGLLADYRTHRPGILPRGLFGPANSNRISAILKQADTMSPIERFVFSLVLVTAKAPKPNLGA